MRIRWGELGRSLLPDMRLRWRLVIAFVSVSALPVLLACYIAADIISSSFADSMERWLEETAVFVAQSSAIDEKEAWQAAGTIAISLSSGGGPLDKGAVDLSAQLLTSVGYDAVAVYDAAGHVLFADGPTGDGAWLPRTESRGFFLSNEGKATRLLLGAARRFERDGRSYYVFVADRWDVVLVDMSQSVPGLVIKVHALADEKPLPVADGGPDVPPGVLESLSAGAQSIIAPAQDDEHLAAGYAALRDGNGRLVGLIVCRLANQLSLLAHVRTQELFLALSGGAALISLLVALSLSQLISRPLSHLTKALRQVREGDFKTRMAVTGGGELKELAIGFNKMAAQLEAMREREAQVRRREQLATLGEAAAVLAHEIRNPLGIIKTSTQVLRMKSKLPPDGERMTGFVLEEVGRIDHLVHDLLDYARPRTIHRRPVDVGSELLGVLSFAGPDLEQRRIHVAQQGSPGPYVIQADAEQLHQVFLNIVLNAMDAMADGGVLTSLIDREGDWIVVRISDTGPGVDPEVHDRLFDPFVTTKPRGTGLGLARVRHIVEQHGGTVACESIAGVGTSFILRLPIAPPDKGDAI